MGPRRPRQSRGPALWLAVAFLLLLLLSLGLRYGGGLRGLLPAAGGRGSGEAPRRIERAARAPERDEGEREERRLRIQILNATGIDRLALQTGDGLRAWGVDVLDRGNAPAWPFPETLLLVRERGTERYEDVERLARRLGGVPVILQRREDLVLDATLVLGHDWEDYDWPAP